MKNHPALLTLLAASSFIAAISCPGKSKESDPTEVRTLRAPIATTAGDSATLPDPFAEISVVLDKVTRDRTADLAAPQESMNRRLNEQIAAWKASGGTSTTAAEGKFALARTDFAQKLRALSFADDTTWKNTKSEALISLQNQQLAYRELLAGPEKN